MSFPPSHPTPPSLPLYIIFLFGPSPWPRKVAMATEADLMQRQEMNYTVRESCVCVCM